MDNERMAPFVAANTDDDAMVDAIAVVRFNAFNSPIALELSAFAMSCCS